MTDTQKKDEDNPCEFDLCLVASKTSNKNRKVIKDLKKQHGEVGEWKTTQVKDCTNNLL